MRLVTMVFLLVVPYSMLYADGGYITRHPDNVWEPRQMALLKYDSTD
jgi:hypothetical protein